MGIASTLTIASLLISLLNHTHYEYGLQAREEERQRGIGEGSFEF
jgi:hypothetical protein